MTRADQQERRPRATARKSASGLHAGDAPWQALARLMERASSARSLPELCFIAVNETWQVMPFRQAVFWRISSRGLPKLQTVSGLARLTEDSPNTVWLKRLGLLLHRRTGEKVKPQPSFLSRADVPPSLAAYWEEFLPDLVYVLPLTAPRDGRLLGLLALALDEAPTDQQQELAQRAVVAYGHAWQSLSGPSAASPRRSAVRGIRGWLVAALAGLALLLPVRLSVLAPAEVIALDALAITAPMDGVVRSFSVQPNQAVPGGTLLFTLDDTTLRNRREVAAKQLQVARADALAAAQKSFANETSRAELASLTGRVAEREAELAWLDEQVGRIQVRAPAAGVVVFGDVNDWIGKPVVTGERVALLGDPDDAGVLIWLPVADAISIEPGAQVRLFLQVAPLEPLQARLSQTSYQSVLSPDGVSSYRLRASFDVLTPEQRQLARIGLKGTAKIFGEQATLGYYLFRRPLAALREWSGW